MSNLMPSSGTAIDFMQMGIPYSNLRELQEWVELLLKVSFSTSETQKKSQLAASLFNEFDNNVFNESEHNISANGRQAVINQNFANMLKNSLNAMSKTNNLIIDANFIKENKDFIDAYFNLFARRNTIESRLEIINAVMECGFSVPQRVVAYPIFENFVKTLFEKGAIEGTDKNIYFADYNPNEIIMNLCIHTWNHSSSIFKKQQQNKQQSNEPAGWESNKALLMCINSVGSLYLSKLYEIKTEYDKILENKETFEDLKNRIANGDFSKDKAFDRNLSAEQKHTPFIRKISEINRNVAKELCQFYSQLQISVPEQMKNFNSNACITNSERKNAFFDGWRFVSASSQSLNVAKAIKDIGFDTFSNKVDEINEQINSYGGGSSKKKSQIVVKIASGKTNDIDYGWFNHVDLTYNGDPFGYGGISENDDYNQKLFSLACNIIKENTTVDAVCNKIGETIKDNNVLSRIGDKPAGGISQESFDACRTAIFSAISKNVMSGLSSDDIQEGAKTWQSVDCKCSSGIPKADSFMRR